MNEVGVDLSSHVSKGLQAVPRDVDYVITLCGDAAEHCPILPARIHVENWDLPDPAKATGTSGQILAVFRNVRDEIERRIKERVRGWMAGDRQ
jgi:arsenate reductase